MPTWTWGWHPAPPEERAPKSRMQVTYSNNRWFYGGPANQILYTALRTWLVESSFYPGPQRSFWIAGPLYLTIPAAHWPLSWVEVNVHKRKSYVGSEVLCVFTF